MSIAVPIPELRATTERYDDAFVLSVGDDLRPRVLSLRPSWRGDRLVVELGRSGRHNAAARPSITLVYPSPEPGGFSLIVDATAEVEEEVVALTPTWAVLHRPAPDRSGPSRSGRST